MERLTFEGNFCDIAQCQGEYRMTSECADGACSQRKVWERLKAYEDTGLEPNEIEKRNAEYIELTKMTYGPLHKKMGQWLQANMDGRLVVLPCKKGDTLFVLTWDNLSGIEETKCSNISIINREDGPCAKITARCVYDDWGGAVREFFPEDFGKTVFLTRKEAEAALKEGE